MGAHADFATRIAAPILASRLAGNAIEPRPDFMIRIALTNYICAKINSARGIDDALARQNLPAATLVFDFLDAAEVRHVLAENDLDHAGLSLEDGDAVVSAAHMPACDDLTSRICRPRRLPNGPGDVGGG